MNSGIYQIENLISGRRYIGSTVNFKNRFRQHKCGLRGGKHENTHLQKAWAKYGEDAFSFTVLLYCEKENLIFHEQRVIDTYNYNSMYNISPTAGNCSGCVHPKETLRGNPGARKGSIPWNKGKVGVYSSEAIKQMSETAKGRIISEETKRKMSDAMKGRISPLRGRTPSIEARNKISKSLIGNTYHKGISHSEETRRKMREAHNRPGYHKKITSLQALEIRDMRRHGVSRKELSLKYGLKPDTIYKIYTGRLWPNVGGISCQPT